MKNNFDLIELFAAFQVLLTHSAKYFKVDNYLIDFLSVFPGVPIFFFVSGYLIFSSYQRLTYKKTT